MRTMIFDQAPARPAIRRSDSKHLVDGVWVDGDGNPVTTKNHFSPSRAAAIVEVALPAEDVAGAAEPETPTPGQVAWDRYYLATLLYRDIDVAGCAPVPAEVEQEAIHNANLARLAVEAGLLSLPA